MKDNLSVIKLLGLLVLAPMLIYIFAFSKTIMVYREYQNIKRATNESLSNQRESLTIFEANNPRLISTGGLLDTLSKCCRIHRIEVESFVPELNITEAGLKLYSAKIVFSGTFIPLVHLVSKIDSLEDVKIASLKLDVREQRNRKKDILLEAKLYHIER